MAPLQTAIRDVSDVRSLKADLGPGAWGGHSVLNPGFPLGVALTADQLHLHRSRGGLYVAADMDLPSCLSLASLISALIV